MANDRNFKDGRSRDLAGSRGESGSSIPNDLPDNEKDSEKLRPEETIIELPDVKDIPGQEFIHAAPLGELADTTISSADEEGTNIIGLNDDNDTENDTSESGGDIGQAEKEAVADENYMPTRDENNLRRARMDNVDFQGEPLNEKSFGEEQTGSDLDIPTANDEIRTSAARQGDEENKHYSLGGDENDALENRTGA